MTDVVNPKSASPDQLLPYHKKISAEGKALMICFISYTYMVLKSVLFFAARCMSYRFYMEILICGDRAVASPFKMPFNNMVLYEDIVRLADFQ